MDAEDAGVGQTLRSHSGPCRRSTWTGVTSWVPMVAAEKHGCGLGPDGWGFGFWLFYSLLFLGQALGPQVGAVNRDGSSCPSRCLSGLEVMGKGPQKHSCTDVGTQLSRGLKTLQPGPPAPRPTPPAL